MTQERLTREVGSGAFPAGAGPGQGWFLGRGKEGKGPPQAPKPKGRRSQPGERASVGLAPARRDCSGGGGGQGPDSLALALRRVGSWLGAR
jgi:hypothetical protein